MLVFSRVIRFALLFALCAGARAGSGQSADDQWWDGFNPRGVNGPVAALALYGAEVVADGSEAPPGVYVIRIETAEGAASRRMVRVR